jgi:alanine-alpha-ketoisovalerate/valine-pyruvate aminotransferase
MNTQEREINLLRKVIATQNDLLKLNKDVLVPMYKDRIKELEANIKELSGYVK